MQLYSYWRSSSAYRVRIALNLKGLDYELLPINLAPGANEQLTPAYRTLNPQGLVPLLIDGPLRLSQSLAICEHLDQRQPEPPLLPGDPAQQLAIRELALAIACEIQPLNNLRVLKYLKDELGQDQAAVNRWYRQWITVGFDALETRLGDRAGPWCFGASPSLADCLLLPQLYNARRFDCPLDRYPRILEVEAVASNHDAFVRAHPDAQPDRPGGGAA